jgi:hypothetical protein
VLVHRFDVATLGNAERTPQGFLRIPAYLTRVGVLEYRRADGELVRELRPRDEVFRAKSLATLSAAPVTDLHPTQMVTPKNVRQLQIGHVSDEVKADGKLVAAHVTIQEADAIAAVEAGKRRELSCGYQCRIDATPGEYEGERYDQVQRDIVYNHVAIGPKNWGRAGRDVALRVDSADADGGADGDVFRLDEADGVSVAVVASPDDGGKNMDPVTIHVDGIDVKVVDKQGAQLIEKAIGTRDDALAEVVGERDALQGRLDAAEGSLKETKTKLAAASDPKRLDDAVTERTALIDAARRVLPDEHKYDGQTPRQIQSAVLVHIEPGLELKDRTDEYVAARFDQAMSERTDGKSERSTSNLDDARRVTSPPPKRPAARADAKQPPVLADWQKPLSYHRARTKVS